MKKLKLVFYGRYAFAMDKGKRDYLGYYVTVIYSKDGQQQGDEDGYFPAGTHFKDMLFSFAASYGLLFGKSDFDISVETGKDSFYRWETNSESKPYSKTYWIEPLEKKELEKIMNALLRDHEGL